MAGRALARTALPILLGGCHWFGLGDAQPSPAELIGERGFRWGTDSSRHFVVRIDQSSAASGRSQLVLFQLDRSRSRVLKLLELPDTVSPIHVFVVGSRERMDDLVGRTTNGIAFPQSRLIVLVTAADWSASATHELFHVLAAQAWGPGPTWLNEGMAVFADGQWQGSPIDQIARKRVDEGKTVSLKRLQEDFRDIDEELSYPLAASLVSYIHQHYGLDAIRSLWQDEKTAQLRGRSLEQVEQDWLASLRAMR